MLNIVRTDVWRVKKNLVLISRHELRRRYGLRAQLPGLMARGPDPNAFFPVRSVAARDGVNFAPRTPAALWPAGPTPASLWPAGPTATPSSRSVPWPLGTALISRHELRRPYGLRAQLPRACGPRALPQHLRPGPFRGR